MNAQKYRCTLSLTSALDGSENYALLCYYAASSGNCLQTLRDSLSVPSSRVEYPKRKAGNLVHIGVYMGIYKGFLFGYSTFEEGTDRLSRNVGNYHHSLRNNPEECSSHLLCGGSLQSRIDGSGW